MAARTCRQDPVPRDARRSARRVLSAALMGLALFGVACRRYPPIRAVPDDASAASSVQSALSSAVVRALPANTELLLVVAQPRHALEALAWSEALARDPDGAKRLTETLERRGYNIDLARPVASLGFDPDRPIGIAVIGIDRPVVCLFGSIGQGEASPVARRWGRGSAQLDVRRGDFRYFLSGKDASAVKAVGQSIADAERGGLLGSPRFRSLEIELGRTADVGVYVRSASLLQRRLGIWDRAADPLLGSSLGTMAHADLSRGRVTVRGFSAIRQDSLLDRALRPSLALVPTWPSDEADGMLVVSLDDRLVGEVVRGILGWTGDPAQARIELEKQAGMSLEEILRSMNGEVGGAWAYPATGVWFGGVAAGMTPTIRSVSEPCRPVSTGRCFSYGVSTLLTGEGSGQRVAQEGAPRPSVVAAARWASASANQSHVATGSLRGHREEDGLSLQGEIAVEDGRWPAWFAKLLSTQE